MTRKLSLRKEALTELTAGELSSVAGASGVTCLFTGNYPSLNAPCPLSNQIACGTE